MISKEHLGKGLGEKDWCFAHVVTFKAEKFWICTPPCWLLLLRLCPLSFYKCITINLTQEKTMEKPSQNLRMVNVALAHGNASQKWCNYCWCADWTDGLRRRWLSLENHEKRCHCVRTRGFRFLWTAFEFETWFGSHISETVFLKFLSLQLRS